MDRLKDFFNAEKTRIFTPDAFFPARVMARLRDIQSREYSIWDAIPGAARPVFGLAIKVLLAFIAVQLFLPQMPEQGFITAALEAERSQSDAPYLYTDADLPADHELINQLMGFEDR